MFLRYNQSTPIVRRSSLSSFCVSPTLVFAFIVRQVLEKNISTIETIQLSLDLSAEFPVYDALIEGLKAIINVLNKRDESVQFLMKIMDEKFENVWGIPWGLGQIIHSFVWNREDVRHITSKASFTQGSNARHSKNTISFTKALNKQELEKRRKIYLDIVLTHVKNMEVTNLCSLSSDFPRLRCDIDPCSSEMKQENQEIWEELEIFQLTERYYAGKSWEQISQELRGRSPSGCKTKMRALRDSWGGKDE